MTRSAAPPARRRVARGRGSRRRTRSARRSRGRSRGSSRCRSTGRSERREHADERRAPRTAPPSTGNQRPAKRAAERDDDEHRPGRGEQVAERLADRGAEDVARRGERVTAVAATPALLLAASDGVAGDEDRPAQQADDLHDRRGDADRHRDPHRAVPPRAARRRSRSGRAAPAESARTVNQRADGALVVAEDGEHLAGRLVEHVGVVEDRAERGEADVGQDGGEDQQGLR